MFTRHGLSDLCWEEYKRAIPFLPRKENLHAITVVQEPLSLSGQPEVRERGDHWSRRPSETDIDHGHSGITAETASTV